MNGFVSRCRPAVYLVVFFYCWSGLGIFSLVQAMDRGIPVPEPQNHWEELAVLGDQVRETLSGARDRLNKKQSASSAVQALSGLADRVREVDEKIRLGFEDMESWLAKKDAHPELFERNARASAAHEAKMEAFYARVKAVTDASQDPPALAEGLDELKKALEPSPRPESPLPFNPDRLPHRAATAKSPEPRLGKDKPGDDKKKGVLVADLGFLPLFTQAIVAAPPVAGDLAETVEVKFTPEILALAASLNNDPVKIYEYVRNNIAFEPTYGSIKGAAQCLWEKSGNDFDQASLMIALLRASGVSARYEYGTVEIPIAQVMNWLGAPSALAAVTLLSSGGVPAVGLTSGGELVAVRLEHVWVRAYLDYTPSRGGVFQAGDRWVSLDPSFKQYEADQGVDWNNQFNMAPQTVWDQMNAGATQGDYFATSVPTSILDNKVNEVKGELNDYLTTHPVGPMEELIGVKRVIKKEYGLLPCTRMYEVVSSLNEYAEVPDNMRHKITFRVDRQDEIIPGWPEWVQDWSYTASIPELAGKPITLSYQGTPATENYLTNLVPTRLAGETDEEYLARWPSSLNCTLMSVKPELKVDGVTKASGTFVDFGYDQVFTMIITSPGGYNNDTIQNEITAGTYQAVVLNLGVISKEFCTARETHMRAVHAQLTAGNTNGVTRDNFFGEVLFAAGLKYWAQNNFNDIITAKTQGVQVVRLPSEGIFSYDLNITWTTDWFGNTTPSTATPGGFGTDVDLDVTTVTPGDGDTEKTKGFLLTAGMNGSRMEAAVYDEMIYPLEDITNTGISTAHAIMKASEEGKPIYAITSENAADVIPLLTVSATAKNAITAAVNAGKTVVIPRDPVLLDGWWAGTGYVVADPDTGAGAYMISGGAAGGEKKWPTLHPFITFTIGAVLAIAGVLATTLTAGIGLAIAGMLVACYDLLTTLSDVLSDPDIPEDTKEIIKGALIMFAAIGAILTIAGIFLGGVTVFVAIVMLYMVLSIIACSILTTLGPMLAKRRQQIDDLTDGASLTLGIKIWMARAARWAVPRPSGAWMFEFSRAGGSVC